MADFATWVVAAEGALGWSEGTFLAAYQGNRQEANAAAIDASPVGAPILALLEQHGTWEGTAQQLLIEIDSHAHEKARTDRAWPDGPVALGRALQRVAPNLRAVGVVVEFNRTRTRRLIRLEPGTYKLNGDSSAEPSDSQPEKNRHPKIGSGDPARAERDGSDERDSSAGNFPDGVRAWEQ